MRPAEPLEKFVRFVLRDGSALSVVNWLENAGRAEGLEGYARVLLNWHKNGKMWIYVTDEDEAPIEPMLLSALKEVAGRGLRSWIEEELRIKPAGEEEEPNRKQVKAEKEISKKVAGLNELVEG